MSCVSCLEDDNECMVYVYAPQWIYNSRFTIHECISSVFPIHALFTGPFTRDHAKPLPESDLTGTGGKDL